MPIRTVDDAGEGPSNQQNRTELHAPKTKKEPVSNGIVLKIRSPRHTASKPKAWRPLMQRPALQFHAQVDGLVEQMAVSTLEETIPAPKVKISKTIIYSNSVCELVKKLARQILKLLTFLTYEPFMITPDEIIKWQHLLDNVQDTPEKEPEEELESSEPRAEQRHQHASLSHPLEKSTCFGHLPIEIRLLIWKYARPEPRVVRLAWSKLPPKAPARHRHPEYWQANYSEAPIPAMLHACSESRQIALGWYRLAFQHGKAEPHVYFDFSADILHVGCRDCDGWGHCDEGCLDILKRADAFRVSKLLIPCPRLGNPFISLYLRYRFAKEILIYDATTSPLTAKTQLSHLEHTIQPFDWQKGRDLYTYFGAMKALWISKGAREQTMGRKNYFEGAPLFKPERLTRVELAVTPETCKIYGFMEKQFMAAFLPSNGMANSNPRRTCRRRAGGRNSALPRQRPSVTIFRNLDKTFLRSLLDDQSNETGLGTSVTIFRNLDKTFLRSLLDDQTNETGLGSTTAT